MTEVKYFTTFLLLLLCLDQACGQKIVKKAMLLPHITSIQIEAQHFSEVQLTTTPGVELQLEATMEGEYQKDIGIEMTEDGNTLTISGSFQPFFEAPNDKLSAHKVVAVSLQVRVPEDQIVAVYGTNTRVMAGGIFRELEIVLSDGQCSLENPEGFIRATTLSGDIFLSAETGVVKAESKYGKVDIPELPVGKNRFNLESVRGDIYVRKTH
ncbi:hypothetical protein GCM10011361_17990 [Muriicola marianensis]|uniref:Adhesin domain-containing protein n=1 Tax=Muriicola marianensis TaxID=1324801 RepID=A0ABQ1R1T5_9FLAO|nr:hypothetical protein GCM10011361_17990 [Muriicola marianensis]